MKCNKYLKHFPKCNSIHTIGDDTYTAKYKTLNIKIARKEPSVILLYFYGVLLDKKLRKQTQCMPIYHADFFA